MYQLIFIGCTCAWKPTLNHNSYSEWFFMVSNCQYQCIRVSGSTFRGKRQLIKWNCHHEYWKIFDWFVCSLIWKSVWRAWLPMIADHTQNQVKTKYIFDSVFPYSVYVVNRSILHGKKITITENESHWTQIDSLNLDSSVSLHIEWNKKISIAMSSTEKIPFETPNNKLSANYNSYQIYGWFRIPNKRYANRIKTHANEHFNSLCMFCMLQTA